MHQDPRLDAYLNAVTAPLTGDEELRLDIRAELASHVAEAAADFEFAGLDSDTSLEEAIKTLGDPMEYAADLVAANQSRMRLRGRVRLLLRTALVPVAILVSFVLFVADFDMMTTLAMFGGIPKAIPKSQFLQRCCAFIVSHAPRTRFTPEQKLILSGDPSRSDYVARQRAIWEAHPTSIMYLNHYLSQALGHVDEAGKRQMLMSDIERGEALDPHNARYAYLRAGLLLQQATAWEVTTNGTGRPGESQFVIRDRDMLDRAMQEFRGGLAKPELRSYAADMVGERLAILGPPRSMRLRLKQVAMASGMLLPDPSFHRSLMKASVPYAKLLISEGRVPEARTYLDAWQIQTCHLIQDSTTLIPLLVASAIVSASSDRVTRVYLDLGDSVSADRTMKAATMLDHPFAVWRQQRNLNLDAQQQIELHGGFLTGLLWAASKEDAPSLEALAPSRLLDYVLLDRFTTACISLVLFLVLLGALLIALRWRFIRGGAAAPLLLLPGWRDVGRIQLYGVVMPLVIYRVWAFLPWAGRDYSIARMQQVVLTQAFVLALAIVYVAALLCSQAVRTRSAALNIAAPPRAARLWWTWLLAGMGAFAWLLAQVIRVRLVHGADSDLLEKALVVVDLALALMALGGATWALGRALFGSARWGHCRGTAARSLIPHLAMAMLLVNVLATPYLYWQERHYVSLDTSVSASGLSSVEARLVYRLRAQVQDAAKKLERQ